MIGINLVWDFLAMNVFVVVSLYYYRLVILLAVYNGQIKCQGMGMARTQHWWQGLTTEIARFFPASAPTLLRTSSHIFLYVSHTHAKLKIGWSCLLSGRGGGHVPFPSAPLPRFTHLLQGQPFGWEHITGIWFIY